MDVATPEVTDFPLEEGETARERDGERLRYFFSQEEKSATVHHSIAAPPVRAAPRATMGTTLTTTRALPVPATTTRTVVTRTLTPERSSVSAPLAGSASSARRGRSV